MHSFVGVSRAPLSALRHRGELHFRWKNKKKTHIKLMTDRGRQQHAPLPIG